MMLNKEVQQVELQTKRSMFDPWVLQSACWSILLNPKLSPHWSVNVCKAWNKVEHECEHSIWVLS